MRFNMLFGGSYGMKYFFPHIRHKSSILLTQIYMYIFFACHTETNRKRKKIVESQHLLSNQICIDLDIVKVVTYYIWMNYTFNFNKTKCQLIKFFFSSLLFKTTWFQYKFPRMLSQEIISFFFWLFFLISFVFSKSYWK